KGIYKSGFPEFVTDQLVSNFLVSESIFLALTYGGFPTIKSNPSFTFTTVQFDFQSNERALPQNKLNLNSFSSSPCEMAKSERRISVLFILVWQMSKPKIFSSNILLKGLCVS